MTTLTIVGTASDAPDEPAPISGVSWSQYLAIERAVLAGGHGRRTMEMVAQHGVEYSAYAAAAAGFMKQMMRNPAMQTAYAAAIHSTVNGSRPFSSSQTDFGASIGSFDVPSDTTQVRCVGAWPIKIGWKGRSVVERVPV